MDQAYNWATVCLEGSSPPGLCKHWTGSPESLWMLLLSSCNFSLEISHSSLLSIKGAFWGSQHSVCQFWPAYAPWGLTRSLLCRRAWEVSLLADGGSDPLSEGIPERMTQVDLGLMVGTDWQHTELCFTPPKKSVKRNSMLWATS